MRTLDLFISPHNDDETLFGSFTIQRVKPLVIVMFDSYVQVDRGHKECDAATRRQETLAAMTCLVDKNYAISRVTFLGFKDNQDYTVDDLKKGLLDYVGSLSYAIGDIYVPAFEKFGHDQHNLVSTVAQEAFSTKRVTQYLTYTKTAVGKSTSSNKVKEPSGEAVARKLQALACYTTQLNNEALGCRPHFMRDLYEYYA